MDLCMKKLKEKNEEKNAREAHPYLHLGYFNFIVLAIKEEEKGSYKKKLMK